MGIFDSIPFLKKKEDALTSAPVSVLDDQLAPSAISINSNSVQIGEKMARTLFVSTLPRYLNTNWFSPVINLDRIIDVAIYFHPADSAAVLKKLRDKLARLQSQAIEEANQVFSTLMGNEVEPRKIFIQTHAKMANLDV